MYLRESTKSEQEISKIKQFVSRVVGKNKQADLFHKAFLKPIEIALKTGKTQNEKSKYDSLPYGLKQVLKNDISQNNFVLADFQSFGELEEHQCSSFTHICENNYDNLISLIKPLYGNRLKLAICVCMYSEDKSMLRRTLSGISNNIATFVRNGYSPDDIGVFFIMDGIEVVDPSVVQFFAEMEKQNFIYLDDDVQPSQSRDLINEESHDLEEDTVNINRFIFDSQEWKDRQKRRFVNRKKEYHDVKAMIKEIEKMQKDKTITYEDLSDQCQQFFIKAAREAHKKEFAEDEEEMKKHPQSFFIKEYAQNLAKSRPLISQALNLTKQECYKYFQSRQNMALLNSFRYEITINQNNEEDGPRSKEYNKMMDEKEEKTTKVNLFMITKYVNRGKLSSHNWFFNGVCKELQPEYSILLDVGLAPEKYALYKMIKHMENDKKVGGVCGYMALRIERLQDSDEVSSQQVDCVSSVLLKCVDIQRAQQMQYHFAHLVDKPFEALFNFIHVLPGAFSAYRMKAVQPHEDEDSQLLKDYFKSISEAGSSKDLKPSQFSNLQVVMRVLLPDFLYYCFFAERQEKSEEQLLYNENVYLAEDRTLCMGIYQNGFELSYIPDAYAWVDPMKNLHGLLGQRKRWINGSFFAFQKVKQCLEKTQSSNVALKIQMLYLTLMNSLAFISPALFLFTIHVAMFAFTTDVLYSLNSSVISIFTPAFLQGFVHWIDFIYVMVYLSFIYFSMHLTNKNNKFVPYIYATSSLLGVLSLIIFIILGVDLIRGLIPCKNQDPCPQQSFLITNPQFVETIGLDVILSLRYVILAMMGVYIIPIMLYVFMYCQGSFLVDIIFSTFSFLFYGPTYLNVLNIYALCRIDDISWGTKGLDSNSVSNEEKSRKQTWKRIKILHVSKYIFWNTIIAFILMTLANDYVSRFILTYVIMVILAVTLFIKVFIGIVYMIMYKCSNKNTPQNTEEVPSQSQIEIHFKKMKNSLYVELNDRVDELGKTCADKKINITQIATSKGNTLHFLGRKKALQRNKKLMASKLSSSIRKSYINKSKMQNKIKQSRLPEKNITIEEQKEEKKKGKTSFRKEKSIFEKNKEKSDGQKTNEMKPLTKNEMEDSFEGEIKKSVESPMIQIQYNSSPEKKEKKKFAKGNKLTTKMTSSKLEETDKKFIQKDQLNVIEEEDEKSDVKKK